MNDGTRNNNPAGINFWALVQEDFRTHRGELFSQGFWTVFWHRFGNWRMSIKPRILRLPFSFIYKVMFKQCEWICGMMLPYTVILGRRVRLEHFGGMILVAQSIGSDVVIRQNTTFGIASGTDLDGWPTIEDGVDIGAGAVIIGRVTVGAFSVVGANAVVVNSVPPYAIVGGVPARILRLKTGEERTINMAQH